MTPHHLLLLYAKGRSGGGRISTALVGVGLIALLCCGTFGTSSRWIQQHINATLQQKKPSPPAIRGDNNTHAAITHASDPGIALPEDSNFPRASHETAALGELEPEPWWIGMGRKIARPYQPWTNFSWCVPQHDLYYGTRFLNRARIIPRIPEWNFVQGLIYVKSPKTGSSTGADISLNMARHVAQRHFNHSLPCTVNYTHPFAHFKGHGRRSDPSLLWAHVRHPVQQALSLFFHFFVSRQGVAPTATNLIDTLRTLKSSQLQYLNPSMLHKRMDRLFDVQRVFHAFDFCAVSDRMDESLVVMKLLYNLEWRDVLVVPSKRAGLYHERLKNGTCAPTVQPFAVAGTEAYLQGEHVESNWDYVLFAAANHSLDLTIETTLPGGRAVFERELLQYRRLYRSVLEICAVAPTLKNEDLCGGSSSSDKAKDRQQVCVDRVLTEEGAMGSYGNGKIKASNS